jgi:ribosomal protein L11 methyltransferase
MRAWPAIVAVGPAFVERCSADSEGVNGTDDETSDLFAAALLDYDVAAIDEPAADTRRLFFHDTVERARALNELPSQFPGLAFTPVDIDDEDWAARSQANLKAVRVGNIVVAPPWDRTRGADGWTPGVDIVDSGPMSTPGVHPSTTQVVIEPSMGFGTGHHATTRLCLAALQQADVRGKSVIDVGTGSGVLAIAASLLGAAPVIALDDDEDAIQSARENLELNPDARVDLRVADLRTSAPGIADVVLANLTGTLLVQAAAVLLTLLAPRGRMILSGLMASEEPEVTGAFRGFRVLDRTQEDEWVCLVLVSDETFR